MGTTKIRREILRLGITPFLATSIALCALTTPVTHTVASLAYAQSIDRRGSVSLEARALVRQAIAATGLILVRNSGDSSNAPARPRGSGVVVRSDGVVATNYHVITSDRTGRPYDEIIFSLSSTGDAANSGTRHRLKPMLISKEYDLALLRVDSDAAGNPIPKSFTFPTVEIGDSRKIKLLEDLFIIGFPEKGGSTVTVNRGVVEGIDILSKWIKTDARVIHGNSGGAAVNSEGRLVGIPTKVIADEQPIDKNGDGFPDGYRQFGAVGFLRPSHLVTEMLDRLDRESPDQLVHSAPTVIESSTLVTVRGVVKSAVTGKPIAGALVGLLPLGETNVTEKTLLTWGSTNADGAFKLNKPVPPGRYTVRAKAIANRAYTRDVDIGPGGSALVIELNATSGR